MSDLWVVIIITLVVLVICLFRIVYGLYRSVEKLQGRIGGIEQDTQENK